MLRMGYMASDFHPKLLVLGGQDELRGLAQLLSRFSESGGDFRLGRDAAIRAVAIDVQLREVRRDEVVGLFEVSVDGDQSELAWRLTRQMAADFATQVTGLVNAAAKSGSVTLECGRPDEIKVIVSYGEWDDDFLVA